jgi:hypothetical protein
MAGALVLSGSHAEGNIGGCSVSDKAAEYRDRTLDTDHARRQATPLPQGSRYDLAVGIMT